MIEVRAQTEEDYHRIQIFITKILERRGIDNLLSGTLEDLYNVWNIYDEADDEMVKYIDNFIMEASTKYPETKFGFRFTDPTVTYDSDNSSDHGFEYDGETDGHFFKNGEKKVYYYP